MKNTLFTAVLCTFFLAVAATAQQSGRTTRYWDACKPSCAWTGNAGGSPNGAAIACNVSGAKLTDANARNACESGPAYTCMGQVPWAISDNESYGFAATHTNGDCGKCFELTFTSNGEGGTTGGSVQGKKLTVMVSNIGGDVPQMQFDLMIPGGGVGAYNALSNQLSQNGVSNVDLGVQYGGFRGKCGNDAACVKRMCDAAFGTSGLSDLKRGCEWYIDWFKIANNPTVSYKEVTCPQALVSAYKEGKGGNGNPPPPTTTYTLTMSVNPNGGGTTNPASSQANISSGTPVNISATPATGYTFSNWTVTSGTATFGNANSQNTTVSLTANATVRANFTPSNGGNTYTLTVNVNPAGGGTTNPASSQANIQSGTPVSISATPSSGYTFTNWTVVSGTATIASPNSQNTTVTLTANATVRANFTPQTPGGGTYTLTVTRSPSGSGSTTPSASQANITAGAPVSISATPNNGYSFVNWTVTVGTATFDNADAPGTTVTLSSNATISANFRQGSPPGGNKTDTTKIEAETSTPTLSNCVDGNDNQSMCIGNANGIKNIGYISNGSTATYQVSLPKSGAYAMEFRIALNGADVSSSTFTVSVNGSQAGSVTSTGTGGWDTYQIVRLNSDVQFNQGDNTIVLNFGNAINVDYILLLGEGGVPVRFNAPQVKTGRTGVTLTASPRGFTAMLPSNHGYTSYRLIDLQGREVRSGKIGDGMSSLKFSNLKNSVLLLRLEGKNTSTVVKAVTY